MMETKKRRGRPRKNGNISPASTESNKHVGCQWKAMASPSDLKIILRKWEEENSPFLAHEKEVSSTSSQKLNLLLPKLTLCRIDPPAEQNVSVLSIDNEEDGQSLRQISFSSIIRRPDMQQVFTQSIFSMNSLVEDNSGLRQRSRKVLKDVKNTSSSRKIRTNVSVQPSLDGQENVPISSSYDTGSVVYPAVCVRLPQLRSENLLQRNLVEKKYVESSTTYNSLQDSFKAHFQSLTVRGINDDEHGNRSSEMIMESFTHTRNEIRRPVQLKAAELPTFEAASSAKTNGRRKSRIKKSAPKTRKELKEKMINRKNTRSSPIVTRRKAIKNSILQFSDSSSQETNKCKTIPSSEISLKTFEHIVRDQVGTQIIRQETALQIHSTSFENQDNGISNFPESPSRLQKIDLNFRYSSFEEKTTESSEQQSSSDAGKRKWIEDDSFSEVSEHIAPKKRSFSKYHCGKVESSRNVKSQLIVNIERLPESRPFAHAISKLQPCNNSESRTQRSAVRNGFTSSSSSYVTRKEASKNKESFQFNQIPFKKVKGSKVLKENSAKSDVIEHCHSVKPEVKRKNVRAKKKSCKTEPVNFYSCYRTRQKTAESGEPAEFFRIPWKQTKGFEVVSSKPKKVYMESESDSESTFKGWAQDVHLVLPKLDSQKAETSIAKKGILKHREMLASSTPFPESSRKNCVSFVSDEDTALSPVQSHTNTNTTNHVRNGFPLRSCTVRLTCLPTNLVTSLTSPSRSKRRMTRREARQKAEAINNCRKKAADLTSYKITPLKEDRIPKMSKTKDDYGIDDINTDDSTDDEEFPKKCIPQWVKDLKYQQPRYQSYANLETIQDWIKPPEFQCSLRHVFFSDKSHNFITTTDPLKNSSMTWDAKNSEIWTMSVERTWELLLQVTTSVNTKGPSKKRKGHS